jgi:hypothetical protein
VPDLLDAYPHLMAEGARAAIGHAVDAIAHEHVVRFG